MKTQQGHEKAPHPKSLHQLVGVAVGNVLPAAVRRNSFIVNEVPRNFVIQTDEAILSKVLDDLLSMVTSHSKHSCIRIKAKEYEDIIFVSVKDNNSLVDYKVSDNLEAVKQLARGMNGSVNIENIDKTTTILLSFPNFPKAA